jgi:O-methyltransferase domain/Dimerisation domain
MLQGYRVSHAIFAAAKMGVADLLIDGPRTAADLAAETNTERDALLRLLRALAIVGVFDYDGDCFSLTPRSQMLRSDVPGSLWSAGIYHGAAAEPAWSGLLQSVQTGKASFPELFGAEFFPWLGAHPEIGANFQNMMSSLNLGTNAAITGAFDFQAFRRIVDVGGGNGSLLAAILKASPSARGVLFDLPAVREQAIANLTAEGVIDRSDVVTGDFFESVPAGADCYTLRWILHDHDDERCERILGNMRKAIAPGGRLLVLEMVIDETALDWRSCFLDLQMLINFGGKERTMAEFTELFERTGFALESAVPAGPALHILAGAPV